MPVLAVVVLAGILIAVATLWDGGLPDTALDPVAGTPNPSVAVGADQTRPRHDRENRVVDGQLIEPLDAESRAAQAPPAPDAQGGAQLARAAEAGVKKVSQESATFKIATFNVLAVQHTEPGGQHASWPSASWRTPQTVGLIRSHGADIVGLQEVKTSQLAGITGALGYDYWPGGADPDDSVIWNPTKFELVAHDSFSIFFMTHNRPQTVVRLRERSTRREFYVINMHTSAGYGGRFVSARNAAYGTLSSYVNQLKSQHVPIFVTGDMNDRENFYCHVIPATGLHAAQGGGGTCGTPPRMRPVDWIVGSPDVEFSGYVDDFSAESRKISDHPFVSATATIVGSKG